MTEKVTNIARNTSYFTLALIFQKLVSLAYFTIYARQLGPEDLGQYYFAISVTSIFAIFTDIGLANVLTREVAKHPEKASNLVSNVIALKLPLTLVAILALVGWSEAWDYAPLTQQLIYISSIAMLLDSFTGVFYAASRGFHNLKFESIASVIFQVIVFSFSMVVLSLGWPIQWLMVSLVLASIFNFTYSFIVTHRTWKLRFRPQWDRELIRHIIIITLPFAVFMIFQRLYTYFDAVLLFKLAGDRAVGLYQIPFKIIMALQFLPLAFVASLYPALSTYWHRNREQLTVTFERAINYSLIISVPIAIGTFALADKIILLFTAGFAEATWPLQVSIMAVPFMFLGFSVGSLLNACDRQKRNTINMIITSLGSVGLNLILIPRYGVLGACITTVVTSGLMLGLGWVVVPKIITHRAAVFLKMLARVLAAGVVMGAFVYFIKPYLNPVLVIAAAGLVYVAGLYLAGGFSRADIQSIYDSFLRKKRPI